MRQLSLMLCLWNATHPWVLLALLSINKDIILKSIYNSGQKTFITNLSSFIGFHKFCAKFDFHRFLQESHEFHVMVNINDICTYSISQIFKWMRQFLNDICECSGSTHKNHNFIQNYITIITQIQLKCKFYVLHIKTSQVKKTHHLYIYIYSFETQRFCTNIFFMIFTWILLNFS